MEVLMELYLAICVDPLDTICSLRWHFFAAYRDGHQQGRHPVMAAPIVQQDFPVDGTPSGIGMPDYMILALAMAFMLEERVPEDMRTRLFALDYLDRINRPILP
jgi:hypothetical protein